MKFIHEESLVNLFKGLLAMFKYHELPTVKFPLFYFYFIFFWKSILTRSFQPSSLIKLLKPKKVTAEFLIEFFE